MLKFFLFVFTHSGLIRPFGSTWPLQCTAILPVTDQLGIVWGKWDLGFACSSETPTYPHHTCSTTLPLWVQSDRSLRFDQSQIACHWFLTFCSQEEFFNFFLPEHLASVGTCAIGLFLYHHIWKMPSIRTCLAFCPNKDVLTFYWSVLWTWGQGLWTTCLMLFSRIPHLPILSRHVTSHMWHCTWHAWGDIHDKWYMTKGRQVGYPWKEHYRYSTEALTSGP